MPTNPMQGTLENPFKDARVIGPTNPATYNRRNPGEVRGKPDFVMRHSELKAGGPCWSRWIEGYEDIDTEEKRWGNLVDCMFLSRETFDSRFMVHPEKYTNKKGVTSDWAWQSPTCREWRDEKNAAGITVINPEDLAEAKAAVHKLNVDGHVTALMYTAQKQVMVIATYVDDRTGLEIPVKCLIDILPHHHADKAYGRSIADLKSTKNAAQEQWTDQVARISHHSQAAFYTDMYNAAMPEERRAEFLWIIQEKDKPYQIARRRCTESTLELGRLRYRYWMEGYCRCLKTGIWTDYESPAMAQIMPGWSDVEITKPWQML